MSFAHFNPSSHLCPRHRNGTQEKITVNMVYEKYLMLLLVELEVKLSDFICVGLCIINKMSFIVLYIITQQPHSPGYWILSGEFLVSVFFHQSSLFYNLLKLGHTTYMD